MAQYATNDQLSDNSLPSTALTGISAEQITSALVFASGIADGYLKKVYALPLLAWGDDLRAHVCDLAAYRLMKRRGFKAGSGTDVEIVNANDRAMRWLENVAKGLVEPQGIVDSTPTLDEQGPLAESADLVDWGFVTSESDSDDCGC